jgi:ABC-type lipoprotein release transport system permease subunit
VLVCCFLDDDAVSYLTVVLTKQCHLPGQRVGFGARENALKISHATFLALTGVGIGVIIAAAAAIAIFAQSMNQATASVNSYNSAASKTPTVTQNIQRAQSQSMLRAESNNEHRRALNPRMVSVLTCQLCSLVQSQPLQQVEVPRVGADPVK